MKIKITLVDKKGDHPCHRGHKIGDTFDYDTDRGKFCPMALHTLFPMIDILRYGGQLKNDRFCCPDANTINIFRIEKMDE